MTTYVDSSVLLRVALGQPDRLASWREIDAAVTSALTEVECLRTLDRRRQRGLLSDAELAERRGLVVRLLQRMERVELSVGILRRAADPFPTPLGTLDALHLATALLYSRSTTSALIVATHDRELATAAQALGLAVQGV